MTDGPPSPPDPRDAKFREQIEESEEFQSLQETVQNLQEMLSVWKEEKAYKEAATLGMVPREEKEYARELVGTLLMTSLESVELVTGYYATAREDLIGSRGHDEGEWYSTLGVMVVTVGPREDTNFGRGHISYHFIEKYETAMGPLYIVPDTGGPDPDDYEQFGLREAGSFRVDERIQTYRSLLKAGVFDHLLEYEGYDSRDELKEAVGVGMEEVEEDRERAVVDVFPPGYEPPDIVAADKEHGW